MVRMWLGVGIVATVLVAGVALAAARPGAVSGAAVAGPPAGPPAAGDCLLEDPWSLDESDLDRGPLPSLRVAACAGARYGEVVSVGAGTDLDDMWDDGSWDQCWGAITTYLGLPSSTGANPDRYPVSSATPTLIGPDERQRAAGQDWSACVVGVPPAGGTDAAPAVEHSLRGSWNRDEDGRLFALCLDDDRSQEPVSCGRPHGVEQVSYWDGDPDRPAEADLADCRRDAVDALGATDALDGGALQVVVAQSAYDDSGDLVVGPPARAVVGGFYIDCMLAPAQADRQLTGPLRGLGDGPVPLR